MPVDSAFISSIQTGFEDIRAAAGAAVRALGMHAEMAEEASASPGSPRRTLLEKIGTSDVFILILGPRYGDVGESGFSPTEDEFNEAIRLGRDVLVFVQEVEMEADQREFLDRVRGAWEDGRFYRRFTDVSDIGLAIAGALSELRAGSPGEDPQAASQRALELAKGEERSGMSSGPSVRVAFTPLHQGVVLDAVGLEDAALEDDLSQMLRQAGLVPQALGIETSTTAAGVSLLGTEARDWGRPAAFVHTDGSIMASAAIHGDGAFGGSLVDPERLDKALSACGRFARQAWERIDAGGTVTRVAITAAIPDAQYKGWGGNRNSNSMSPGMSLPATVIAPDPPEIVPSAQADSPELARRLSAALKRVFLDAGAVQG